MQCKKLKYQNDFIHPTVGTFMFVQKTAVYGDRNGNMKIKLEGK